MKTVSESQVEQVARAALDAGEGILRLAPAWVPRSFLQPGKRIKLHPDDYYALGKHRGGIDERWFASTTVAANEGQNGGGIYLSSSSATVDGNQILANTAGIGGGLYIQEGKPKLDNNIIARNQGFTQAGAAYLLSTSPEMRHTRQ